jgi:anthranilate phosphoribosyltransferase
MTAAPAFSPILSVLASGRTLSAEESRDAFDRVMSGQASEAQIASLLTALAVRPGGPTVDEIVGAARAMRSHALLVPVPPSLRAGVIDTCGTGGDHAGTFNISTAAAIIAAAAGATVAKHGNRSVTSTSGSSQVLEALGVKLLVAPEVLSRCLAETRLCFCFAPAHHPAMKHAAPVRQQLGFRTIFNLLGPLTNPAGATRQLMGVYHPDLTQTLAQALQQLGAKVAMVVHGSGLDELTIADASRLTTLRDGRIDTETILPEDLGLTRAPLEAIRAASVDQSAAAIRQVLAGQRGPHRSIACLNAAAALVVAGVARSLPIGLQQAYDAVDSGAARSTLDHLARLTQS